MNKVFFSSLLGLAILFLFSSCDKETEDFLNQIEGVWHIDTLIEYVPQNHAKIVTGTWDFHDCNTQTNNSGTCTITTNEQFTYAFTGTTEAVNRTIPYQYQKNEQQVMIDGLPWEVVFSDGGQSMTITIKGVPDGAEMRFHK